ncbi:MAG: hypothetical protein ABIJ40_12815 [Bacteroidota bacterium]
MNQPQTGRSGYFTLPDFDERHNQDTWQLCPACNGTGFHYPVASTANNSEYCKVCDGKKIISKINGRPPSE